MTVAIRISDDSDEVQEILASPKFQLHELSEITHDGYGATFDTSGQHEFSVENWAKVYQARGDFSVIGIEVKRDQPVPGFDNYVRLNR